MRETLPYMVWWLVGMLIGAVILGTWAFFLGACLGSVIGLGIIGIMDWFDERDETKDSVRRAVRHAKPID